MQYRVDPKSGKKLSALGFGCMRFPSTAGRIDVKAAEKLVLDAVDQGVNYFDTAYIYNGSESAIGEIFARNPGVRERVNLATKLPVARCVALADFDRYLGRSLARLGTDYVDYYLIHNLTSADAWEALKEIGIGEWVVQQKASGKIRQIGFSYHGPEGDFPKILDAFDWDFCQIQLNYMNEHYQAGVSGLAAAAARGLPVIVMEPLLGGKLANDLPKEARVALSRVAVASESDPRGAARVTAADDRAPARGAAPAAGCAAADVGCATDRAAACGAAAAADCATTRDARAAAAPAADRAILGCGGSGEGADVGAKTTPARLALRWVWDHPEVTVVLSGMNAPDQLRENVEVACCALPGSLTDAERAAVAAARTAIAKSYKVPCTGCGYCMPCPRGVNIPMCFAAYNTSFAHGWYQGMHQYVTASGASVDDVRFASDCVCCGACASKCPQHIDVPARLADVRRRLQVPGMSALVRLGMRVISR